MKRIYLLISLATTLLLFTACGGGGGGDDDPPPVSYTGSTTQAVITSDNAVHFAKIVFGPESEPLSGISDVTLKGETTTGPLDNTLFLPKVLGATALKLELASTSILSGISYSETEQCESGELTTKLTYDEASGNFSLTMEFDDCVIGDHYTDGVLIGYGILDPYTSDVLQLNRLVLDELTEKEWPDNFTYSGEILFPLAISDDEQICYYMVRDNDNSLVYMYDEYHVAATDYVNYSTLTINGRLYHPTYGYVDVNTTETLQLYEDADFPRTGILEGDGINSSFEIRCEYDLTFTLGVDTDGDGLYESYSTENW